MKDWPVHPPVKNIIERTSILINLTEEQAESLPRPFPAHFAYNCCFNDFFTLIASSQVPAGVPISCQNKLLCCRMWLQTSDSIKYHFTTNNKSECKRIRMNTFIWHSDRKQEHGAEIMTRTIFTIIRTTSGQIVVCTNQMWFSSTVVCWEKQKNNSAWENNSWLWTCRFSYLPIELAG